jgi:hypothetical protein
MKIYKSLEANTNCLSDLKVLTRVRSEVLTRLVEKSLDNLVLELFELAYENVTIEAATVAIQMIDNNPGMDFWDAIEELEKQFPQTEEKPNELPHSE